MLTRIIQLLALVCIAIGATAFAQDRDIPSSPAQVQLSFAPVVKKVAPAVVNIYAKKVVTRRVNPFLDDPFFGQFFSQGFGGGLSRQQVESALGSGVIIEPSGVVVTNAHVVRDAQEIVAVLSDGQQFDARVSISDEKSDVAILRLETEGKRLPFASLKPSEGMEVGDIVLAVGNPFGVGQTVTSGIVSALARSSLDISDYNFFIQTDAAINPGNSGGPLVDMTGGVVGINTAIYSKSGGSLGIGFAIPSEMVASVVAAEKTGAKDRAQEGDEPKTIKTVARPWIGVHGQEVTADIADSLGLDRPKGVMVSRIHPASPARAAGLKVGDVVTAINGHDIRDPAEMKFRLATVPMGSDAQLTVLRKGDERTIVISAAPPPEDPPRDESKLEGAHPLSGISVANLNPAVSAELGIDTDAEGVVVTNVPAGNRAGYFLRPGDRIVALGTDTISDVGDIKRELRQAESRGVFAITIDRGGRETQIVIR